MPAPTAIAASAARWARRMPSISVSDFTRRLVTNDLGVDEQLDPARPQVVGEADRELRRDDRAPDAHLLAGAARQLELDLVAADPAREQLVGAEVVWVEDLDAERADLVLRRAR